jgi:hypothetical protein
LGCVMVCFVLLNHCENTSSITSWTISLTTLNSDIMRINRLIFLTTPLRSICPATSRLTALSIAYNTTAELTGPMVMAHARNGGVDIDGVLKQCWFGRCKHGVMGSIKFSSNMATIFLGVRI